MVERRPLLDLLSHGILLLGVAVVAFPLYLTFVASTHTAAEIVRRWYDSSQDVASKLDEAAEAGRRLGEHAAGTSQPPRQSSG